MKIHFTSIRIDCYLSNLTESFLQFKTEIQILFKLGITSSKTEQPLRGIELLENDEEKDEEDRKLFRKRPKRVLTNINGPPTYPEK